ncbi:hypothetical protein JOM56_015241 [Amanita muscaria]
MVYEMVHALSDYLTLRSSTHVRGCETTTVFPATSTESPIIYDKLEIPDYDDCENLNHSKGLQFLYWRHHRSVFSSGVLILRGFFTPFQALCCGNICALGLGGMRDLSIWLAYFPMNFGHAFRKRYTTEYSTNCFRPKSALADYYRHRGGINSADLKAVQDELIDHKVVITLSRLFVPSRPSCRVWRWSKPTTCSHRSNTDNITITMTPEGEPQKYCASIVVNSKTIRLDLNGLGILLAENCDKAFWHLQNDV